MRKYLTITVIFIALAGIACGGGGGFDQESVKKAIENTGPYDVSTTIDDDNNVTVRLNKITDNTTFDEMEYYYFTGVCIGAVGALAADVEEDLGYLEIAYKGDSWFYSLDFCVDLASLSESNLSDEELGGILIDVMDIQAEIEERVEGTGPFSVMVLVEPDRSKYNVSIELLRAGRTDADWNSFSEEEKMGYYSGVCAGVMGSWFIFADYDYQFEDLFIGYEGKTWSVPISFCADLVAASSRGEASNDELGTALLNKMKEVR